VTYAPAEKVSLRRRRRSFKPEQRSNDGMVIMGVAGNVMRKARAHVKAAPMKAAVAS